MASSPHLRREHSLNKQGACHVITLYTWTTPNGYKASIMLEEIGAAYT